MQPEAEYVMRPSPGAPLLLIVRYKEIEVKPKDGSPVELLPTGEIQVDVTDLLAPEDIGAYGIVFSETTENICFQKGIVNVPGGQALQPFIQNKASEHYEQYCVPRPPLQPTESLCQDLGVGGTGNLYEITLSYRYTDSVFDADAGVCRNDVYDESVTITEFGPLYSLEERFEPIETTRCGLKQFWKVDLVHGSGTNICAILTTPVLGVANVTSASITGITATLVGEIFDEICPPIVCTVRPRPDPLPFDFDAEEPDNLPPGEHAVTTVIVRGEDGKDGRNIRINAINRVPSGGGNFFSLIQQTDDENVYDLTLEDELESQAIQIPVGACDVVNNEYTQEIVEAVLPVIAGSGGYGQIIAAIAAMVFEVAKSQCESVEQPLREVFGGEVIRAANEKQILTIPCPSVPAEFEYYEVFVGIGGQGRVIPTSVDIDQFDQLGSEGVYGVLYEFSTINAVDANPHLLRFPVSCIRGSWKRFGGVKISMPAGSEVGVNFVFYVKPE